MNSDSGNTKAFSSFKSSYKINLSCILDTDNVFVDTFSAYRNMHRVMRTGTGKKELDFLFGLRILSSCYVVIGHRYIMYIMFPVVNQLEELDVSWNVYAPSTGQKLSPRRLLHLKNISSKETPEVSVARLVNILSPDLLRFLGWWL